MVVCFFLKVCSADTAKKRVVLNTHEKKSSANRWNVSCQKGGGSCSDPKGQTIIVGSRK